MQQLINSYGWSPEAMGSHRSDLCPLIQNEFEDVVSDLRVIKMSPAIISMKMTKREYACLDRVEQVVGVIEGGVSVLMHFSFCKKRRRITRIGMQIMVRYGEGLLPDRYRFKRENVARQIADLMMLLGSPHELTIRVSRFDADWDRLMKVHKPAMLEYIQKLREATFCYFVGV